jgi:uncharacterized protein involved in tolerance to divalent cations
MGKKYRRPAKHARSILRLLDYKQVYCWASEVTVDNEKKTLIWKASETLKFKNGINIIENREYFNPSFVALPFSQKLATFQSIKYVGS